jgi:biopolymer transport protein ExbD
MQFERNRRGSGDINITPLIDMVFLLLIFFLLTSSFIIDRGIKINLPKAVSSETAPDNRITVAIDSTGAVFVDNEPLLIESLPDKLKKAYAKKKRCRNNAAAKDLIRGLPDETSITADHLY